MRRVCERNEAKRTQLLSQLRTNDVNIDDVSDENAFEKSTPLGKVTKKMDSLLKSLAPG